MKKDIKRRVQEMLFHRVDGNKYDETGVRVWEGLTDGIGQIEFRDYKALNDFVESMIQFRSAVEHDITNLAMDYEESAKYLRKQIEGEK